jgi:predicted kinase
MTTEETTVNSRLEYDLTRLQTLIGEFKQSEFWKVMENTVENSPWHREANVAVHTLMTLEAAAKHFPKPETNGEYTWFNRRHITLVTLALLFHDTGKPEAEVTKESEERGVYRSYAGHEQQSARAFEGYVIDNWTDFEGLITVWDVYVITWMIEHHLPYGLKQKDKVLSLDKSLVMTFLPNGPEVFFNMLMGDTEGRDSDAYETNCGNMRAWIAERQATLEAIGPDVFATNEAVNNLREGPELIMLIGPSGAGKSSLRAAMPTGYVSYSLDDLRYKFAFGKTDMIKGVSPQAKKAQYRIFYDYVMENEAEFNKFADEELVKLFKEHQHIYVDNTNVGAKRRRKYTEMARQRGMRVTALYIPASLRQLQARQLTRDDKQVPESSVSQQFHSVAVPSFGGEFDTVLIAPHNFGL